MNVEKTADTSGVEPIKSPDLKGRIGISLISTLISKRQLICGNEWLKVVGWLKYVGYDFLMGLPLRGLTDELIKKIHEILPIRYYETAWNDRPHWRLPLRMLGLNNQDPTLADVVVFPRPKISSRLSDQFRLLGAEKIVHDFSEYGVIVELSPGLWMIPEDIAKKCRPSIVRCAIDTYHLRRAPRKDEIEKAFVMGYPQPLLKSRLGDWRHAMEVLLPVTVCVHIHGCGDEIGQLIEGVPTELEDMLQFVRERDYKGDYIVEADPRALTDRNQLWDLLVRLKKILG